MSINKRDAIITFDYEVFLGRQTGTIENSVLKPTEAILKVLKENNAKAIFFVDTTWLLFLKENFSDDFRLVTGQLRSIAESDSSVELHLHPQWINAVKIGNQINFNSLKHYKLHYLSNEEILDLFNKTIDLLQSITNRKVRCFRAGGWCIEPFNKIRAAFEASGIKYDFSVAPGLYLNEGKVFDFDYSGAPKLPYYKFQNDVQRPEVEGQFLELPVSTYYNNSVYRLVNKILLIIKKDKIFGDGKGIKEKSFFTLMSLYRHLIFSYAMLTIDKTSSLYFRYLLQTHFRKTGLLVIISHPKTISKLALNNLSHITKNYNTLNSGDLDKYLSYS